MRSILPALLFLAACAPAESGESNQTTNAQAGGPAGPVTLAVPSDPQPRPEPDNRITSAEAAAETLRERVDAAPADVRDAIERRAGCNHWGGEAGYDAGRRAQIEPALREARCDTIVADIAALRTRHARNPAVLSLLDETEDLAGF